MAAYPLPKAFPTSTFYKCRWCSATDICWNSKPMEQNCRTCRYIEIAHEGTWNCTQYGETIPLNFQRIGCAAYEVIEQ